MNLDGPIGPGGHGLQGAIKHKAFCTFNINEDYVGSTVALRQGVDCDSSDRLPPVASSAVVKLAIVSESEAGFTAAIQYGHLFNYHVMSFVQHYVLSRNRSVMRTSLYRNDSATFADLGPEHERNDSVVGAEVKDERALAQPTLAQQRDLRKLIPVRVVPQFAHAV
jgi:hypothetical protein